MVLNASLTLVTSSRSSPAMKRCKFDMVPSKASGNHAQRDRFELGARLGNLERVGKAGRIVQVDADASDRAAARAFDLDFGGRVARAVVVRVVGRDGGAHPIPVVQDDG